MCSLLCRALPVALALLLPAAAAAPPARDRPTVPAPAVPFDGGALTPNLVPNASMEAGRAGKPRAWSFRGSGAGTWERGTARTGKRSLRIDGLGAWESDAFLLRPGLMTLIAVEARLRGSGRWGSLARLDFLDARGERIGKLDPFLQEEHGWWRMRWAGVAPRGTTAGRVVCYTYVDTRLRAWFDDVEVRQWEDASPPVDSSEPAAGGPVRGFDFGTPTSEVQAGYRRVDPTLRYRAETGFGWTAQVRLAGRDQIGEQYRPMELDAIGEPVQRERTLLDALTRDYVQGVGAARFRVDVPPGRYRVFLLAGHSLPDESPPFFDLLVSLGGERGGRLAKRYPGVLFTWDTFSAEVGEDGLQIGLASDRFGGAWSLAALLVFPEEAEAAGRRAIDSVVRSVRLLPDDLLAEMRRVPGSWFHPAPAGGAAAPDGRAPASGARLLEGGWPDRGRPAARLAARASPGMSADLRFVLQVAGDLEGFTLAVDPPAGPGDAVLPQGALTLWSVEERAVRHTRGYVRHDLYTVQPDALSARLPERLPGPADHRFWLRVAIPAGTAPGTYRSTLHWSWRDGDGAVPLELEVLPFAADRLDLFQNPYLHGSWGRLRGPLTTGVAEAAAALRSREVADIADHLGGAAALVYRPRPVYRRGDGGWGLELAFTRERLEDFRRAGHPARDALVLLYPILRELAREMAPEEAGKLRKHVSEPLKLPDGFWEAFGDLVEELDAALAAEGVVRRLYNPVDEAFGHDLDLFARAARVLRERLDDPRIFCNVPPRAYFGGSGTPPERALAPHCNAWWTYGMLTDEQRAAVLASGTWLMGRFVDVGPAPARAAAGVLRWRRREMGGNWWSYDALRGSANTQLDGPSYGDRCLVYPTSPPSPRLAWEATRMGHEDLRYLRTLERWVEEGRGSPARPLRRAARRAGRFLADLHARVDPTLPEPFGGMRGHDRMRDELLDHLLALHAARAAGPLEH